MRETFREETSEGSAISETTKILLGVIVKIVGGAMSQLKAPRLSRPPNKLPAFFQGVLDEGSKYAVFDPRYSQCRSTVELLYHLNKTGMRRASLGEQSPRVKKIAFMAPAEADVGAVEHVRDDDGFDARVGFAVGFFHRRAGAGDDERVAVAAGDFPIAFFKLHVAQVHAVHSGFGKNHDGIFGELGERIQIGKGPRRQRR